MNIAETISVNPCKKTLGALHPEVISSLLRERASERKLISHKKHILNLVLASSVPDVKKYSGALCLLRTLMSALIIVSGSFIIYGEINAPSSFLPEMIYGISEIVIGTMLAFGFLTRFAMLGATILFGTMAVDSILMGVFNMEALMCCMASMIFLVMGAGRYSLDFLIRRSIIKSAIKRRRKRVADKMSYKAFQYSLRYSDNY